MTVILFLFYFFSLPSEYVVLLYVMIWMNESFEEFHKFYVILQVG